MVLPTARASRLAPFHFSQLFRTQSRARTVSSFSSLAPRQERLKAPSSTNLVPPRHSAYHIEKVSISRPSSVFQARYCSFRSTMCKHQASMAGGSAVPDREVLPTNVKPYHYDLTLEPDFKNFTFSGTVDIR